MRKNEEKIKHIALIALLSFLVYANTLGSDFVWDDEDFIVERFEISKIGNIPYFFTTDFWGVYRPVREAFYALSYTIWGQNPFGYHLNAFLIHTSITILIYLIFTHTIGSRIALSTALLFSTHPVHTEAITFITTSFDEIGVFFFFLSFYFYIGTTDRRMYAASIVFAALAFFTYEVTLTLPLTLVLYDYCFKRKTNPKSGRMIKNIKQYIPFFGVALFYFFVRFFLIGVKARGSYRAGSLYLTLLAMSKALVEYIRVTIIPLDLTVYHDITVPSSIFEPGVLLSLFLLAFLLKISLEARKRSKVVFFGIAWFFITLLPVSNIIPIQTLMAERYLYLPSLGFVLLIAVVLDWMYNRFTDDRKIIPTIFLALILIFYSAATIDRNADWRDDLTLWKGTLDTNPNDYRTHLNLGKAYSDKGMYDDAIKEYNRALELAPNNPAAFSGLGVVYYMTGLYADSILRYKDALEFARSDSDKPKHHYNLGLAYSAKGLYDLATAEFRQALDLGLNHPRVHLNLGDAYYGKGSYDLAIVEYNRALELAPSDPQNVEIKSRLADVHNELGISYGQHALYDLAIAEFKKAIEANPNSAPAHINLGSAYAFIGEYQLARREFKTVIELDPSNPVYRNALAWLDSLTNASMR